MSLADGRLSQAEVERFQQDGVVCLPGALSSEALAGCEAAWQWSMAHPGPGASDLLPGSSEGHQDLCNPSAGPVYHELAATQHLAELARQLWADESGPVWFMYEQVFHKSGGAVGRTPWHQDTSYLAISGEHLIAFWISFEPIDAAHALEFVPGSHRGTLHNTSRFDRDDPTEPIFQSDLLPRLPDIEADRERWPIQRYATVPGDVIAFHTSTLHGGGAVDEDCAERRTLTLRFFGADATSAARPGPAGPFYQDIQNLQPGQPFRHARFPRVR